MGKQHIEFRRGRSLRALVPSPLFLACLLGGARAEGADPVAECIDANERSLDLYKQGHLIEARRALAVCASSECPNMIQSACVARITEINRAIPSLVLEATGAGGQPVTGALASIDGQPAQPLAATSIAVDPGSHTIRFEALGQAPVQQTVVVVEGEKDKRVTVVLGPRVAPASRLVVSVDEAAMVSIDGREVGSGRFDGPVPPGPHDLAVTEPGKVPYRGRVEVSEGETRTLSLALEDEKKKGPAALWPWIASGVALAAGAAVSGYFLFRPSDTALGVPPGKTATVQLASTWKAP